jgi:hypothetical protein
MPASGVRRDKAAFSSGCKFRPATAQAGSNRSSYGGDEIAEAFGCRIGMAGSSSTPAIRSRRRCSSRPISTAASQARSSPISYPARVVKAFNHLRAEVLAGDPRADGGRRVPFYSGNDNAAKAEVAALIDRVGSVGVDLGSLAVGGELAQFPGGPLPDQNLVKIG